MHLLGRMRIDALEDIDQVEIGIEALEPARSDQTLHDTSVAGADFGPAEQPDGMTAPWCEQRMTVRFAENMRFHQGGQ